MKLKDLFLSYFDDLAANLPNILRIKKEQTSLILDNFYDNTILQVSDILNKKEIKDLKDLLKTNIINLLKENLKVIDKSTNDIINDMEKYTKEIVISNIKNSVFNINISETAFKECKNKINEISFINKDFIKKFDNQFDLFFYNVSITYKLKNDVSSYNLINKTISQNKKILFDNLKELEDKIKEDVIAAFNLCFNNFKRDVVDLRDNLNYKNNKIIIEYEENILKENITVSVNGALKENVKNIEKSLLTCHFQVLKEQKSRDIKEKEMELHALYNYLISFNNTLFDKSLNILMKMTSSINLDQEEMDKSIKKYNDIIYKICDFEYNFDKQFLLYRQKMLNRKYFLSNKATKNIIDLIDNTKIEIINIIKMSIIDLFKTNVNMLNTLTYKRLILSYKLQNYYEVLDEITLKKLL